MPRNYAQTIQDLERIHYSKAGVQYLMQKADDPTQTDTSGFSNAVFGAQAWHQMNTEANTFGVLPKYPWKRSGIRFITAQSTTTSGVAESGAIPETDKPDISTASLSLKTEANSFEVSEGEDYLASESMDDDIGSVEFLRAVEAIKHKQIVNEHLNADLDSQGASAGNRFETLDRVVSSSDEASNIGDITAGDEDIYGIDRSANTWANAYVDDNSGTDRTLTDQIVRDAWSNVKSNGGNPQFWQTGHDTHNAVTGLYQTHMRFMGETEVKVGVNGVESPKGIGVGVNVSTLYGYPMIVADDTPTDTISRLYLLDSSDPEGFGTPRLGLRIAKPTQYFETGVRQGNPHAIDSFNTEGTYRTMGNLACSFFAAQGKVRDLK